MSTQAIALQIVNPMGLHARPAAQLARLAAGANGRVWIHKDAEKVNAASLLDILTLTCTHGTEITISVDEPADLKTLEQMAALIRSGFGE